MEINTLIEINLNQEEKDYCEEVYSILDDLIYTIKNHDYEEIIINNNNYNLNEIENAFHIMADLTEASRIIVKNEYVK